MRNPPSEPSVNTDIQLTPLIDVVFVVLVCFMLVAPMVEMDQVQLASNASSQTQALSKEETQHVHIHVKDDDTIWIHKKQISDHDLAQVLKTLQSQTPNKKALVFHDRRAKFGTYEWLKGQLAKAGFEEMDIVLTPAH